MQAPVVAISSESAFRLLGLLMLQKAHGKLCIINLVNACATSLHQDILIKLQLLFSPSMAAATMVCILCSCQTLSAVQSRATA